jgi:multidrug resistance efflux pump
VSSDETLGELSRRLDRFEARHERERASADVRHLDASVYIAERNALQIQISDLAADVKSLEARMTWAWRAAMTGIIFPIVLMIVGGILLVRGPA